MDTPLYCKPPLTGRFLFAKRVKQTHNFEKMPKSCKFLAW